MGRIWRTYKIWILIGLLHAVFALLRGVRAAARGCTFSAVCRQGDRR